MGMIKNQDFSRVNLVGDFFIPENESIEDIPCQNLKLIHKFISIEYEFLQKPLHFPGPHLINSGVQGFSVCEGLVDSFSF